MLPCESRSSRAKVKVEPLTDFGFHLACHGGHRSAASYLRSEGVALFPKSVLLRDKFTAFAHE